MPGNSCSGYTPLDWEMERLMRPEPEKPDRYSSLIFGRNVLYHYDTETGIPGINREKFPEGALKKIRSAIREHPEGIEFGFHVPIFGYSVVLKGVRVVRHLTKKERIARAD